VATSKEAGLKLHRKIALVTGVFALSACSAAVAGQPEGVPPENQGTARAPEYTPAEPTPGPKAGLPAQAKAYGRYCKQAGAQKVRVEGQKGTEFSNCVKAMAQAAKGTRARKACSSMSRKHVKGEKGTPFSRCLKAAAKLRQGQQDAS
jgi:hypothetical protein